MQPAEADSRERAVLVAVIRDDQEPRQAEEFLDELEFLAETADIRAVKRFTQRLAQPSARIYVGPGKLQEIADYCRQEKDSLWEETKRLFYPHQIYVDLSPRLYEVKKNLLDQVNKA